MDDKSILINKDADDESAKKITEPKMSDAQKPDKKTEENSDFQVIDSVYPKIPKVLVINSSDDNYKTESDLQQITLENNKKHRQVLQYPKDDTDIEGDTEDNNTNDSTSQNHSKRVAKKLSTSYENPNFSDYKKSTQEYFQFIHRYHPADTLPIFGRAKLQIELRKMGFDHINVVLFGLPGSGKSAFLNTIYYTLTGTYMEYSTERKSERYEEISSVTNTRVELRVTESISIIDNRGLDYTKACYNEIVKQCEGYREGGEDIPANWNNSCKQGLKDHAIKYQKKHMFKNRVQCPIILCNLSQDINMAIISKMIDMMKKICYCNPIIVLTHSKESNVSYKKECIQRFEDMNCARIFTIDNYTYHQNEHNIDVDAIAIEILFNSCLVADQATSMVVKKMGKDSCC